MAKISFSLFPKSFLEEAKREFVGKLKVNTWSLTGEKQEFGKFALPGVDKVNAVHTLVEYLGADI